MTQTPAQSVAVNHLAPWLHDTCHAGCQQPGLAFELLLPGLPTTKPAMPLGAPVFVPAGREQPGKAFRLYTEAAFRQLAPTTLPEIQRSNLAAVVLQLKALGIDDVANFPFMDKPSSAVLVRALEHLLRLGALDSDAKLTAKVRAAFCKASIGVGASAGASAQAGQCCGQQCQAGSQGSRVLVIKLCGDRSRGVAC